MSDHIICKVCKQEKELNSFRTYKKKDGVGYESTCRICVYRQNTERNRVRKIADPDYAEKVRQSGKLWRENNRDKALLSGRKYREKNREKIREDRRGQPREKPIPVSDSIEYRREQNRRYRELNREKINASKRAYRRRIMADPEKAEAERIRKRQYQHNNAKPQKPVEGKPTVIRPSDEPKSTPEGWQLLRQRIRRCRRNARKYQNIMKDPERAAAFKQRNKIRQQRYQESLRNDPERLEAHRQRTRIAAEKRKAKQQQQLIDAITPPIASTSKKPAKTTKRRKQSRSNISTWLNSIQE